MTQSLEDTAHVVDGSGPPVVLVHGMGLNRDMWDWQHAALAERFTVIRYDLLGHGESAKRPGPYGMSDFVDQLARLMGALGVGPCGLVGFSLGGLIVRAFALAHPSRVAALAILNSAHDRSDAERAAMRDRLALAVQHGPGATIDAALERWFTEDFAAWHPDVLDRVRQWMAANDPQVYPEIYRVLAESDAELATTIAAIECPTLVLACSEDHGNSPDMARRMAALIPNARAEVVVGLRHMGLAEDPAAINKILVPFLQETLSVAPDR
ncbi:MAG: alpha/beta fold hydrolase [Alphaproteobacteria bacterium]|nr:alpha/beta fold hydrolase [Alphaproteobacteria bacterium]